MAAVARLDVELGPPPVTPLGVVLFKSSQSTIHPALSSYAPGSWCRSSGGTTGEWALFTSSAPFLVCNSEPNPHLFWREALARIRFVRKDFWEGYRDFNTVDDGHSDDSVLTIVDDDCDDGLENLHDGGAVLG